jgi:isoquinoline 1-oxidoreductase alpha subunit
MADININGKKLTIDVEPDTPLLWALRDGARLTGTKFGCGAAQCGACTVMVDGEAVRACVTPVADVAGKTITTVEGLGGKVGDALRAAWAEIDVPQCG